jgi:hypothetical protein
MSSLIVLVVHGMINHDNISAVRSVFVLSRAFTPEIPGFVVGAVVMMRDTSLRSENAVAALAERDTKRHRRDKQQTQTVL